MFLWELHSVLIACLLLQTNAPCTFLFKPVVAWDLRDVSHAETLNWVLTPAALYSVQTAVTHNDLFTRQWIRLDCIKKTCLTVLSLWVCLSNQVQLNPNSNMCKPLKTCPLSNPELLDSCILFSVYAVSWNFCSMQKSPKLHLSFQMNHEEFYKSRWRKIVFMHFHIVVVCKPWLFSFCPGAFVLCCFKRMVASPDYKVLLNLWLEIMRAWMSYLL